MEQAIKNPAVLQKREERRRREQRRSAKRRLLGLPRYTLGEEIFSAVSHGVSALYAVGALAVLLVFCEKDPLHVACAAIYGATMVLLYTVSTLYHALGLNRAKVVFRSLDHCTIFLLIAAAVLGVVLNAISVERFKVVSMICYLAMGWVVVLAMGTFRQNVSAVGFWCLLSGGICYTVGAALYGLGKKLPYIHGVFHLFVLAGSVLHTISVYGIVA